eukprot:UN32231
MWLQMKSFLASLSAIQSTEVLKQMILDLGQQLLHDKPGQSPQQQSSRGGLYNNSLRVTDASSPTHKLKQERDQLEQKIKRLEFKLRHSQHEKRFIKNELDKEKHLLLENERRKTDLMQENIAQLNDRYLHAHDMLQTVLKEKHKLETNFSDYQQTTDYLKDVVKDLCQSQALLKDNLELTHKQKLEAEQNKKRLLLNWRQKNDNWKVRSKF